MYIDTESKGSTQFRNLRAVCCDNRYRQRYCTHRMPVQSATFAVHVCRIFEGHTDWWSAHRKEKSCGALPGLHIIINTYIHVHLNPVSKPSATNPMIAFSPDPLLHGISLLSKGSLHLMMHQPHHRVLPSKRHWWYCMYINIVHMHMKHDVHVHVG